MNQVKKYMLLMVLAQHGAFLLAMNDRLNVSEQKEMAYCLCSKLECRNYRNVHRLKMQRFFSFTQRPDLYMISWDYPEEKFSSYCRNSNEARCLEPLKVKTQTNTVSVMAYVQSLINYFTK